MSETLHDGKEKYSLKDAIPIKDTVYSWTVLRVHCAKPGIS